MNSLLFSPLTEFAGAVGTAGGGLFVDTKGEVYVDFDPAESVAVTAISYDVPAVRPLNVYVFPETVGTG